MTTTRIDAEVELVKRQGARMSVAGLAVTVAGSNADLNQPMSVALRKMGLTASSPVSNTDLAELEDADVDEFYDRAELRLLENISGNLVLVDIDSGPRSEKLSQISASVEKAIARMEAKIYSEYGVGYELEGGVIELDSQEVEEEA